MTDTTLFKTIETRADGTIAHVASILPIHNFFVREYFELNPQVEIMFIHVQAHCNGEEPVVDFNRSQFTKLTSKKEGKPK